jgi:DNA processing protein
LVIKLIATGLVNNYKNEGYKVQEDKKYWIWLNRISGIGARRFIKLIECYESPRRLFDADGRELEHAERILGDKLYEQLQASKSEESLKKAEEILKTPGLQVHTLLCPGYPDILKTIYDPPPVLYCMGQALRTDLPTIAVVGSRRSSEYGRMSAKKVAFELAQAGAAVVSGMARGIDSMAHRGALEAENGYTIAVLGCGVDYIYPPENAGLYKSILQRGTVISEYPPGTNPSPGNFPARNRIISGLSYGTLVIEAGLKSGAIITVDCALEQGREVYALPGNVNSPFSQGTNKLLKEGAKMVTSVDDILEDLSMAISLQKYPNRAINSDSGGDNEQLNRQGPVLDLFETLVYNALHDGEKGLEDLIQITQMEPGQLNGVLTLMEIKGIIKQLPGKIFINIWKA